MSNLTISGHSAEDSLVKFAVMASLPDSLGLSDDMCHLSDDVKRFASSFKASSASLDFKRFMATKEQRYLVILNYGEFQLYQQHVRPVPHVKESSHQLNWKLNQSLADSIYQMIYHLTVAHCTRHVSPASSADLTTVYTTVSGIIALRGRESGKHRVTQPSSTSSRSPQAFKVDGRDLDHAVIHTTSWIKWRSK